MKRMNRSPWLLILPILLIVFSSTAYCQFDPTLFEGMKARSIGPAGMSGRIGDIDVVIANPNIIYVGAATGGLWKSVSGGLTWKPIFDDQPVSSIGSVTVFQPNPSIVWVGTGEGNPRNSVGVGNGAYKSLDGGRTWKFVGLENTEKIHRLLVHPTDPDIAYAGALGTTWGENPERGVYRTINGGKTWKKVLFIDERTGCADLVMDPSNPNKMFAAMWQHRRWPWFFKSGGPGSGLYVTYDGGDNWKQITCEDGLPKGELGRIGIAIARNRPDIVYALIEAKKSVLCRSDDGGHTWNVVNKSRNVNPRPFYYCDIRVDPENENRVYRLHSRLEMSEDSGKSFTNISDEVHLDHHALWIHPDDGNYLIDGNDGGVAISRDRGKTWRFVDNLPLAQFYHINVDMSIPFNVFGGLQDNGSWRGPSDIWENGGIRNYHWDEVGFGDGFATLSDPTDPNMGYFMSQGGNLRRFHVITGERKDIKPWEPDSVELRFHWNAAIAIDPFAPKTIYYGSQFVHKSTDRGDSWTIISPDLTTNDPEKQKQLESGGLTYDVTNAENHTSILTIAPSPLQKDLMWVGSDDGLVHITQDGGSSWTNVTTNFPKLPEGNWCPHIEPSKYDSGTAFAVFDDHRRSNWTTYIFKTTNFGKKWVSLAKNPPAKVSTSGGVEEWGFVHVIEQDPVDKDLLYLGTEFGLYLSFDGGIQWMKWTHGVPTVPVRALIVHPRDHDLVIGTHGRAAYILDDVRPLRAMSKSVLQNRLHLFDVPPAYQHIIRQVDGYHFPADAIYAGETRDYGAMISYYVDPPEKEQSDDSVEKESYRGRKKKDTVSIKILDKDDKVVRKMDGPMKKGIQRIVWNLRRDGFRLPGRSDQQRRGSRFGPQVLPGIYTVQIKMGDRVAKGEVEVLPDPRENIQMVERKEKFDAIMHMGQRMEVVAEAVDKIQSATKAVDTVLGFVKNKKDSVSQSLAKSGKATKKKLEKLQHLFMGRRDKQGIFRDPDVVMSRVMAPGRSMGSSFDKPTQSQRKAMEKADKVLSDALNKFNMVFENDIVAFQNAVRDAGFDLFPNAQALDIEWKAKKEKK